MISKKYWDNIVKRMQKQENRKKYEDLDRLHIKEDELIKYHIKRIRNYFSLNDDDKNNDLNITNCSLSIRKVNSYFDANGWK